MTLGIMQPYFLPYIGYWQLLNAVDKYVIYDNIQYTKKGWINRNRILNDNDSIYISIPLKKDSDYLDICNRQISDSFNKAKLLNQIKSNYKKAPYFLDVYELFEHIVLYENENLFSYIFNSIKEICTYLSINTEFIISSTLEIDHSQKGINKVIAICKKLNADTYYNAIGGIGLYDKELFRKENINLSFLETEPILYKQFKGTFQNNLSILDVLMFNSLSDIKAMLNKYELK